MSKINRNYIKYKKKKKKKKKHVITSTICNLRIYAWLTKYRFFGDAASHIHLFAIIFEIFFSTEADDDGSMNATDANYLL